jgi:hypothetical protein
MRRGFSQTLSKMSLTRNLAANSLVWHVSVHFRKLSKRSPAHGRAFYDCP